MIITSIKKNRKNNIRIFADEKYLFDLSPEVFIKSKLKVGDYINEEIINKISSDISINKAKEKALRLLSLRAHSKRELKNKIKSSSDEQIAEIVVQKMENSGLIDDFNFAKAYAQELSLRKYYTLNRIKYELIQKGISQEIISKVLSEISIDEQQNASVFIQKKYAGKLEDDKFRRRAISALQRLGYSWNQINIALNISE